MKKLFLVLLLLIPIPLIQAFRPNNQSPPLEILATGKPIQCGALYDFLGVLEKAWGIDKNLMRRGIYSPKFKEDYEKLMYFQELFLLAGCRTI